MSDLLAEILQDQNPWWRSAQARRATSYPYRRRIQPLVVERIRRLADRRASLVLGPRQVGKTVLLLQAADDLLQSGWPAANLLYFDFSDDRLSEAIDARRLIDVRPAGFDPGHPRALLLDEISRSPRWDLWLKQVVDAAAGVRIVATDSAAAALVEGGQESGQGRWDELRLQGLSFGEFSSLNERPGAAATGLVERYLALGGFPEHAIATDIPEVRRRLRSDIADRALRRDLGRQGVDVDRIARLFAYLVEGSGDIFSARARAADLAADPRTTGAWLELLLQTQLLVKLPKWYSQASANLRAQGKVYAAYHGMIAAFALDPEGERVRGRLFEAAVFRQLRELSAERQSSLTFFRSHDGVELDFVLHSRESVIGIEVTAASRVRTEKVEAVQRAGKRLGADRLWLIHGGAVSAPAHGGLAAAPVASVGQLTLTEFLLAPAAVIPGIGGA